MKAKQIEKLLTGVLTSFIDSIYNDEVKGIIKKRCYITGGCIPSMLIDEWVNDYDIYFYDEEDVKKVKEYFRNLTIDTSTKFHVKLITENSINLSDKIQLVTKFIGPPEKIVESFDWKHIKSYFYWNGKKHELVLTNDVYKLIVEKELIYTGSEYPLSSLLRLKKYLKKGWNVSTATMVHIALDIVVALNTLEKQRKNNGILQTFKSIKKDFELMSIEEYNEKYDICKDIEKIDTINLFDNIFNDLPISKNNNQILVEDEFYVDDIIFHLNGVDPLIIQQELQDQVGKYLSLNEIIRRIDG